MQNPTFQVKKLLQLTFALHDIVGKIISSGDTECLQRMAMVVMAMQRDLLTMQEYFPNVEARYDRQVELDNALQPVLEDKASLQRYYYWLISLLIYNIITIIYMYMNKNMKTMKRHGLVSYSHCSIGL